MDDARPPDPPVLPDSALPDSDDRGDIGENFCQPPLLPPSRPELDPAGLDADPELKLRASVLLSEPLSELAERAAEFAPDPANDRCDPLFMLPLAARPAPIAPELWAEKKC